MFKLKSQAGFLLKPSIGLLCLVLAMVLLLLLANQWRQSAMAERGLLAELVNRELEKQKRVWDRLRDQLSDTQVKESGFVAQPLPALALMIDDQGDLQGVNAFPWSKPVVLPDNVQQQIALAQASYQRHEDPDYAHYVLQDAFKRWGDDSPAIAQELWWQQALLYEFQGRMLEARQAFQECFKGEENLLYFKAGFRCAWQDLKHKDPQLLNVTRWCEEILKYDPQTWPSLLKKHFQALMESLQAQSFAEQSQAWRRQHQSLNRSAELKRALQASDWQQKFQSGSAWWHDQWVEYRPNQALLIVTWQDIKDELWAEALPERLERFDNWYDGSGFDHLLLGGESGKVISIGPKRESLLSQSLRFNMVLTLCVLLLVVLIVYLSFRQAKKQSEVARMKSEFVAGVSHELKTPLTHIRMFAETLERKKDLPADKEQEFLQIISGECERLTQMLDNVLDFSRLDQKQLRYHPQVFDPKAVIQKASDIFVKGQGLTKDQFKLEMADDLPRLSFDQEVFPRILINLLSNAYKYGGNPPKIMVRAQAWEDSAGGQALLLEVHDNGSGIKTELRDQVFDRFVRLREKRVQAKGGSGLGLTLVKHALDAHQAKIEIKQSPWGGALFSIIFATLESSDE